MKNFLHWFEAGFAFVGLALVALFCYYAFPHKADRDIWDVITAISTVAAVGVALWIATGEARRRHADLLAVAHLTAAAMTMRLATVRGDLKSIVFLLEKRVQANTIIDFREMTETLQRHANWDMEEIIRLTPLPRRCAYKLAGGIDRMSATADLIRQFLQDWPGDDQSLRNILCVLTEAHKLISDATDECQKASLALTSPYS